MEGSTSGLMLVLASTVLVMLIGFGIAFYFQRRTKTAEDWAMGGRSLPSYVIVFTQFATLVGGGVLVGHVGDSRAYRLRGGELKQITQDHSIVAELLRNNVITAEMARNHPYRNVITRAVGVDPVVTPDVIDEDKQPDDVWLVCSDGLYNIFPIRQRQFL